MAKGERAFWSSLPGVLTGLAGILTAGFGLVGLAVSQGWIGDGGGEAQQDSGGTAAEEVVRISADPETVELTKVPLRDAVQIVVVTNEGTGPVAVTTDLGGEDAGSFGVDDEDCTRSEIPPGRSCDLAVTFDADAGTYRARLLVAADGGEQIEEVELRGNSGDLLG